MAKFVLLLATFALFLLLTNASIYRIEIDEENPRRGTGCSMQMEQQQNLRACRRFIEKECCSGRCSCSCKGGSCSRDENTKLFEQCCDHLEAMDEKCRCMNLKQMVEQHMMEESMSQRMKEKMYDSAEGMLKMCRIEPMTCDMGSRSVFT